MVITNSPKTEHDKMIINDIARSFGLYRDTAEILFNRGIKTEKDVEYFLNPGKQHFKNPFDLSGMRETVDRLNKAKELGETVIVYGDYDVDGICATTILYLALTEYGIKAVPFVPERATGYGLNKVNVDKLIEEHLPDLIITVDCGISCYNEVEYIKNLGVDVIVTDHHELPSTLPNCVIVNCKIPSSYGFDNLCGAGVAFKVATALIKEKAYKYLDLAGIATVADSMPLINENRDIVYEGLKLIKNGYASKAVQELVAISNIKDVTSTSLAFTIAPRINAAGRMGEASSALQLLLSTDSETITRLAAKLNVLNQMRQQECEALYKSAREKLIRTCYDKKIIILADDDWNNGLVGIIAARLVEEFSRPVILFVNNEGHLHGSARSIDKVNIFEAISSCQEYLTDFGGHAQAAGVSIDIENFEKFTKDMEKFIDEKYPIECFKPVKTAEMFVDKPFSLSFAKELQRLEPFGIGNKKPLFVTNVTSVMVSPIKYGSNHLSIKTPVLEMLYFNGISKLDLLSTDTLKQIVFEPNISYFNHEESLRGYVKDVDFIIRPTKRLELESYRLSLLTALHDNDDFTYASSSVINKLIDDANSQTFGTIFAVFNPDTLDDFKSVSSLDRSLGVSNCRNLVNNVVIAPTENRIVGYKRIIYLDRPLGNVAYFDAITETYINREKRAFDYLRLDTSKETFADIFKKLKNTSQIKGSTSVDIALTNDFGYSNEQVVFVLEVFLELNFFCFQKGYLRTNSNEKTSLSASKIYEEVEKLKI